MSKFLEKYEGVKQLQRVRAEGQYYVFILL